MNMSTEDKENTENAIQLDMSTISSSLLEKKKTKTQKHSNILRNSAHGTSKNIINHINNKNSFTPNIYINNGNNNNPGDKNSNNGSNNSNITPHTDNLNIHNSNVNSTNNKKKIGLRQSKERKPFDVISEDHYVDDVARESSHPSKNKDDFLNQIKSSKVNKKNTEFAIDTSDIDIDIPGDNFSRIVSDCGIVERPKLINKKGSDKTNYYIEEITDHFLELQEMYFPSTDYFQFQHDLRPEMRSILIDWIIDIHHKFKFEDKTLFLTVTIIDRYCELELISKSNYQLLGTTCLWIAAKYEELQYPKIADLIYITANTYNQEQIIGLETKVVNALKFQFTYPTIQCFLELLFKVYSESQIFIDVVMYFSEKMLQEIVSVARYRPSVLASACVFLGRKYCNLSFYWNSEYTKAIRLEYAEVQACANEIEDSIMHSNPNLTSVFRKFSSSRRSKASYIVHEIIGDRNNYLDAILAANRKR